MDSSPRAWGFWTEVKLDAIERYLQRFTTASAKASTVLYLDLFSGSVDNVRRDEPSRHFTVGGAAQDLEQVDAPMFVNSGSRRGVVGSVLRGWSCG